MAAHVAALRAGEAYRAVTESAIHVFGGIGFTWEHDAHLYYRRAWSAERLAGRPASTPVGHLRSRRPVITGQILSVNSGSSMT